MWEEPCILWKYNFLPHHAFIVVINSSSSYIHHHHTFIVVIHSSSSYIHRRHTFIVVIHSSTSYIHRCHTFIIIIHSSSSYIHCRHTFINIHHTYIIYRFIENVRDSTPSYEVVRWRDNEAPVPHINAYHQSRWWTTATTITVCRLERSYPWINEWMMYDMIWYDMIWYG